MASHRPPLHFLLTIHEVSTNNHNDASPTRYCIAIVIQHVARAELRDQHNTVSLTPPTTHKYIDELLRSRLARVFMIWSLVVLDTRHSSWFLNKASAASHTSPINIIIRSKYLCHLPRTTQAVVTYDLTATCQNKTISLYLNHYTLLY